MPVQPYDGSYTRYDTGLDPRRVPQYAGVLSQPFGRRSHAAMPKNPVLAAYRNQKTFRVAGTNTLLTRSPSGILGPLYKPGGLLYRK